MKSKHLTKKQKTEIKRHFREGMLRREIAKTMGVSYAQVQHTLEKQRAPKPVITPTGPGVAQETYDQLQDKYRKLLVMCIEHGLIEVDL